MINNLHVLDSVEKLVRKELTKTKKVYERQLEEAEKKLALQKRTPWGQLAQPETTHIGYYYERYGEFATDIMLAVDAILIAGLTITGVVYGASSYLNSPEVWNNPAITQNIGMVISKLFGIGKVCACTTGAFLATHSVKLHMQDKIITEEKLLQRDRKNLESRKKDLVVTLQTLRDLEINPEWNFLSEFLNNVNLEGNGTTYNKELMILLAKVSTSPTKQNLTALANYLRASVSTEITSSKKGASPIFLQNGLVKQLVHDYAR